MKHPVRCALVELALPIACFWVRKEEAMILRAGVPLDEGQLEDARQISIASPEQVRVLEVATIPPRLHPVLRSIGRRFGLRFSETIGMALQHGIFVRAEHISDRRLLLHELAHVAQYERLGLREFLRQYLRECLIDGYPCGALEAEAREVTETMWS